MRSVRFFMLVAVLGAVAQPTVQAAPYASGITKTGTTVNFLLNQDAETLKYSINGGPLINLPDGAAKGAHTFNLNSASDTFSIVAEKTELGFTTADSGTILKAGSGLAQDTASSAFTVISDDASSLNQFNSPRGVGVNQNPNSPYFGTSYVTNSIAGTTASGRALVGEGVYALKADQTDAFGFGDTAQFNTFFTTGDVDPNTQNSPYKLSVAADGNVYVAGFGDEVSGVYQVSPNLSSLTPVLAGNTGPTALPIGQNHGSVLSVYVTGSTATNNLAVYTIDEDLSTLQVTGSGSGTDTNKLWKYEINGGAFPYSGMPTKVADPLIPSFSIINDFDRGVDGKWYLSQNRGQPASVGAIYVTDANGNKLFDSRVATAAIYGTPEGDYNRNGTVDSADYVVWRDQNGQTAPSLTADGDGNGTVDQADFDFWRGKVGNATSDLYSNVFGLTVSPDQKWLAALHNNGTISITPLVNGIPDVANRLAVRTSPVVNTARDIAFDAAGNLHYVSSGQALYRILAPGGHSVATTTWNGTAYTFGITNTLTGVGAGAAVPEPGTIALAMCAVLAGFGGRRRT